MKMTIAAGQIDVDPDVIIARWLIGYGGGLPPGVGLEDTVQKVAARMRDLSSDDPVHHAQLTAAAMMVVDYLELTIARGGDIGPVAGRA